MTRRLTALAFCLALAGPAVGATVADQPGETVALPGIRYQVLAAGPAGGAHPKRGDSVTMRYVGRLESGEIFSTSPGEGKDASVFPVNGVIPGMGAALQLMRVGDHWKITMPPYLAYGPGRPFAARASAAAQASAVQQRGIPPDATLIFDVEVVSIEPAKAP
jgi:FKBP-type peptidyl-prolyl cis-trans isomerase